MLTVLRAQSTRLCRMSPGADRGHPPVNGLSDNNTVNPVLILVRDD